MKKVLLIINPVAGKSRNKSRVFHIAEWFQDKGCVITAMMTSKKGDAVEFVKQYADVNDAVVCCGGDGTLNEVITGMMQCGAKKPIGYLPAGTTNDMAKTLRLPGNVINAAKIVISENPVSQDLGTFNGNQYFTYIASFGAFTKVSYATPQWLKNRFGHLAYVIDGIKSVGKIHPCRLKMTSAEHSDEGEFIFGSVTNSSSVGGMLKFKSSEVCLNDGKFEVLLIRKPKNAIELRGILYGLLHQKLDKDNIVFFHTNQVSFRFENPPEWTVDGEFAGQPDEVHIKNLHNAIQIIRRQ